MAKKKKSKVIKPAVYKSPYGGRPKKYKSPSELQKLIDAYFASCWEPIMDYVLNEEAQAKKDADPRAKHEFGPEDHVWVQRSDYAGNPLFRRVRPYSITGLALSLGTNRETLMRYEKDDKFYDTIRKAKTTIQNYVEEGTLLGEISPLAGSFNLKNNFGWKDRVDHTSDDERLPTPLLSHAILDNDGNQKGSSA